MEGNIWFPSSTSCPTITFSSQKCILISITCMWFQHGLGHKSGLNLLPHHVTWQGHSATSVPRKGMWGCAPGMQLPTGSASSLPKSNSLPSLLECLVFLIFLPLLMEIIPFSSASPFTIFCTGRFSAFVWEQIYTLISTINLHNFFSK